MISFKSERFTRMLEIPITSDSGSSACNARFAVSCRTGIEEMENPKAPTLTRRADLTSVVCFFIVRSLVLPSPRMGYEGGHGSILHPFPGPRLNPRPYILHNSRLL